MPAYVLVPLAWLLLLALFVGLGLLVVRVVARGATVREAQQRAYAAVDAIRWDGVQYRRDIGYRAIARED